MPEIRAVRSDELDGMLALMCEAFGLPFGPARELFIRDPYFDIRRKRVLVEDGLLVSCLTVVDSTLWIGRAAVRVAGIAGVATRLTHRRRGHASRLLVGTLPVLREDGYGLAALFPFSYDYYRRLGWEQAGEQLELTLPTASLPPFGEARHVRAAQASDAHDLQTLYDRHSRGRTGAMLRDDKRWHYLMDHIPARVVYKRGTLQGYALYETKADEAGAKRLRLLELVASTDAARRGLAGFLAQQPEAEVGFATCVADLRDSGLLQVTVPAGEGPAARVEAVPGPMFRVVDLLLALRALAPNFAGLRGEVILRARDEQAPAPSDTAVLLRGDGSAVEVGAAPQDAEPRLQIEGDVRAWAPVLAGHHSLRDALSLNRLHARSEAAAALAAPLFPRRDLFIPAVDHF